MTIWSLDAYYVLSLFCIYLLLIIRKPFERQVINGAIDCLPLEKPFQLFLYTQASLREKQRLCRLESFAQAGAFRLLPKNNCF